MASIQFAIGQSLSHIIIDIAGLELSSDDKILLTNANLAGVILFSRNYQSKTQLKALNSAIKAINKDLVICVDQEGGRVQRFTQGFTELPALQTIDTVQKAYYWARLMAQELLEQGVDHSFAPVVDVDSDFSSIIGNRSFADSADQVTELASAYIDGLHDAGMAATIKHFPGHGVVAEDSHLELPISDLSMRQLQENALIPFTALATKADAVMTAHIAFPNIDQHLVGYSNYWLGTILRQQLGFDGLIVSDDLSMAAAALNSDDNYAQRTALALKAGCDAVLICNNRDGALAAIDYLEQNPLASDIVQQSKNRLSRMLKND